MNTFFMLQFNQSRAWLHKALTVALFVTAACGTGTGIGESNTEAQQVLDGHHVEPICLGQTSLHTRYRAKQGRSLTGLTGTGFQLLSAQKGCSEIQNLNTTGAQLRGSINNSQLSATDFIGAVLTFSDGSGNIGEARIDQVVLDPMDLSRETYLYTLTTGIPGSNQRSNLCAADASGQAVAIPLRGLWGADGAQSQTDTAISFNCTSGVIAKCVRWGYRPWQSYNGVQLADHHQACTRMARADYCGTGQSNTLEGTAIDLYDNLRMLTQTPALLSLFEASWTPSGAYCIARERWLTLEGLLTPTCKQGFVLQIQSSPIDPLDLCFARRTGTSASMALLSNRTTLNIGL